MARVLGAHMQVRGGRYLAGFAWVDSSGRVVGEPTLPAPVEADRQLSELYQRALQLVRGQPEVVALLSNEAYRAPASLRVACHAEGVLLSAAQHHHVPYIAWSGVGLFKPAGLARSRGTSTQMAVKTLLVGAGFSPDDEPQGLAAAVALAQAKTMGWI